MPPVRAPPSYTLAAHRVQINQFANAPDFISPQFLCEFMVRLKFSAGRASPPLRRRRGSDHVPCGTERCVHPCCVNGRKLPAALRQGQNNVLTRSGWRPWAAAGHRSCKPRPAADNTFRAGDWGICKCWVVESSAEKHTQQWGMTMSTSMVLQPSKHAQQWNGWLITHNCGGAQARSKRWHQAAAPRWFGVGQGICTVHQGQGRTRQTWLPWSFRPAVVLAPESWTVSAWRSTRSGS